MTKKRSRSNCILLLLIVGILLSACQPQPASVFLAMPEAQQEIQVAESTTPAQNPLITPLPTRPPYAPGVLVDYIAQPGDTLPLLANRFNTSIEEILAANPIIPENATTMPPGMPMEIPIYYIPLWGSPYQILPDSLFINGPSQMDFDTSEFVDSQPGWFKDYIGFAAGANRSGAEIVDVVAQNFSVSPQLLLALLEYHAGALSQTTPHDGADIYTLGLEDWRHKGPYLQLVLAANTLNHGFYGYRTGRIQTIEHHDGTIERPDPWQNAASVAFQYYFSHFYPTEAYAYSVSAEGFANTYRSLFGDPWVSVEPHIPGSLVQPEFILPFEPGAIWALTGGPHTGWGTGYPWAALDFAPPSVVGGCVSSDEWATAVAPGVVVRSETGVVALDLDEDGDERTGWVMFYLHIGTKGRAPIGAKLLTGEHIGHPSCEGGRSTGTHIHIARKYNGEWIPAEGTLAFNFEGWIAHNGEEPYLGTLTRHSRTVTACLCSNMYSHIQSDVLPNPTEE